MVRRTLGILAILMGAYWALACQAWGMRLMGLIGFERAVGLANVRHEPDGSILLTNPTEMLFWSFPFLALGVALILVGVRLMRRRTRDCGPEN